MESSQPHELAHYSAGRWLLSQVYIAGWPAIDVVKAGYTSAGRTRFGPYLARGGELLYLQSFEGIEALNVESQVQEEMRSRWPLAFASKADAAAHLGRNGAGYSECFQVPVAQWHEVIDIAKGAES